MARSKTTHKKRQPKRGRQLLTKEEVKEIRQFLPKNWRQTIHETRPELSLRQITEVFNQRTQTPEANIVVWSKINDTLSAIKQTGLAKRANEAAIFYQSLYNGIRN